MADSRSLPAVRLRDLPREERTALADTFLARIELGGSVADIAKERGDTEAQIYRLILRERPEEWKEVRAARTIKDLDEAKQKMREAPDHLSLAKWDKLATRHAWELERVLGRIFGQRQDATPLVPVQININLGRVSTDQPANERNERLDNAMPKPGDGVA